MKKLNLEDNLLEDNLLEDNLLEDNLPEENLEENLLRLEEIVCEMEDENTGLESALALYKKGLAAADKAKIMLEGIESEIQILQEDS